MDALNKTNKRALKFLHCVQTACNDHRMMIEDVYKREYKKFIDHWRKSEPKSSHSRDVLTEGVKESSSPINIEELCLADTLLQRARNVRMNLEKSSSPAESRIASGGHKPNSNKLKVLLRKKPGSQNILLDSDKKTKVEVKPKSQKLKSSGMHCSKLSMKRSSSCNMPGVKLLNQAAKGALLLKQGTSGTSSLNENRSKSILSSAIVSEKEFKSFKNMHLSDSHSVSTPNLNGQNICVIETEQPSLSGKHQQLASLEVPCKITSPDEIQLSFPVSSDYQHLPNYDLSTSKKKQPTDREFRAVLKDSAIEAKLFQPCISWSWYPFLNTANESSLCRDIKCHSIRELETVYSWLHKIQETMLWLDFITLLHKEISLNSQHLDQIDRVTLTIICNIHKIML